jgi:hypothetical protein
MNYEPSGGKFRIHAAPGYSVVSARYAGALGLKDGTYTVKKCDLPLYTLVLCEMDPSDIRLLPLTKGESSEMFACSRPGAARQWDSMGKVYKRSRQ